MYPLCFKLKAGSLCLDCAWLFEVVGHVIAYLKPLLASALKNTVTEPSAVRGRDIMHRDCLSKDSGTSP